MPQISKVRIVNFQYNDGKRMIADELFDFTNHEQDAALNVLINLANGGGKSVLVQLMLQPIIPKAKVAGRRIESFFSKASDHCFILLEWIKDNSSEKLLTGISMAAREGNSTDEDAERGFGVKYYTFYSEESSYRTPYDIVNMPLSKKENGRFVVADFNYVRELSRNSRGVLNIYTSDNHQDWSKKLSEFGLVQNEWHMIEKLNSEEGGLGKFFEGFRSSSQLLDKLFIPTIEEKLRQGRHNGEDESLITMMLSYVKQYQSKQDVIRQKETYETFVSDLSALHPRAEELWNCDDRLKLCIRKWLGFSSALSAQIEKLKSEQADDRARIQQADEQMRHIEWERISADYYQAKENFEKASATYDEASKKAESLRKQQEIARHRIAVLECARYFQQLTEINAKIQALLTEIRHREESDASNAELASLKYSILVSVMEELPRVGQTLRAKNESLQKIQEKLRKIELECRTADAELDQRQSAYDRQNGQIDALRSETDRAVQSLGENISRRLDGFYALEELREISSKKEADKQAAESKIVSMRSELTSIREELDLIPQAIADIHTERQEIERQAACVKEELRQYESREAAVKAVCESYNIDFSLRFSNGISEFLNQEKDRNLAKIGDIQHRISVMGEQLKAVDRGSLHVPGAVIDYLNAVGVRYTTCEKYLFQQVESGKITKEKCLAVLQNYPTAAYGIYINREQIAFLSQCERSAWLPAMIPLFTPEQMEQILDNEKKHTGSIAFYSEDYFIDKEQYRQNLLEQRDELIVESELLKSGKKKLEEEISKVNEFTYNDHWFNEETATYKNLLQKADDCRKDEEATVSQKELLLKKKMELEQTIQTGDTIVQKLNHFLDSCVQVTERLNREIEADAITGRIRAELEEAKEKKTALQNENSHLTWECSTMTGEVQSLEQLISSLESAKAEVDGCRPAEIISGLWNDLLIRYRELAKAQNAGLEQLRNDLDEKSKAKSECENQIRNLNIPEDQYVSILYRAEEESQARKEERSLTMQSKEADLSEKAALQEKGRTEGRMQSAEKALSPYGTVLERSMVGSDFTNRMQNCREEIKCFNDRLTESLRKQSRYESIFGRANDVLTECQVLADPIQVAVEEQVEAQYRRMVTEKTELQNKLRQAEKSTAEILNQMKSRFSAVGIGISEAIGGMITLFHCESRGDRYYTLVEHIVSDIQNARRAIAQIITDLKEFENSHQDLIRQCTLQGQQIYEGLRQMSATSRVTVYEGKPKQMMIRFDIPNEVDINVAQAAVSAEIDQGTKELIQKLDEKPSETELKKAAEAIVGSRILFRKYIGKDTVTVQAYKIDQNPQNGGYRTWEDTLVNNSGAEKFVVYFAVILSLMNFTRSDLGEIHDRDLHSALILDNPFGATSSKHILVPMFSIAKHFNVQMICLSDINKSDVVNCFSMVIKAIVKQRPMSNNELLTHEGNEQIEHGFYRSEQMSLLS